MSLHLSRLSNVFCVGHIDIPIGKRYTSDANGIQEMYEGLSTLMAL